MRTRLSHGRLGGFDPHVPYSVLGVEILVVDRQLEMEKIAYALAEAGLHVELNACGEVTVDGVCKAIRALAQARDSAQTTAIVQVRLTERETRKREFAEKDVANMQRRLKD